MLLSKGNTVMESVRVRIVDKGRDVCVVEYNNREYTVPTSALMNVNAGWTYGYIAKVHIS